MTVKELIARLSEMDPHLRVIVEGRNGFGHDLETADDLAELDSEPGGRICLLLLHDVNAPDVEFSYGEDEPEG